MSRQGIIVLAAAVTSLGTAAVCSAAIDLSLDTASTPIDYDIAAGSYGTDAIPTLLNGNGLTLGYSVDRVTLGLPGSVIAEQAAPGTESAHGDIFTALIHVGTPTLSMYRSEVSLGLTPGFLGDDVDALSYHEGGDTTNVNTTFPYTTLCRNSSWIGQPATVAGGGPDPDNLTPDDVVLGLSNTIFASGIAHMGLLPGDAIDALLLLDRTPDGNGGFLNQPNGQVDPDLDIALFSLDPFSTSTIGGGGAYSPGAIFMTDFDGAFNQAWVTSMAPFALGANVLGLNEDDNIDALCIIPEPTAGLLVFLLAGFFAGSNRR